MTWNYRLIKHDEEPKNIWYGLHEVYYNEDKSIWAWTENPFLVSDTAGEMIDTLEMILDDLESQDVLIYSDLDKSVIALIGETDEQ